MEATGRNRETLNCKQAAVNLNFDVCNKGRDSKGCFSRRAQLVTSVTELLQKSCITPEGMLLQKSTRNSRRA